MMVILCRAQCRKKYLEVFSVVYGEELVIFCGKGDLHTQRPEQNCRHFGDDIFIPSCCKKMFVCCLGFHMIISLMINGPGMAPPGEKPLTHLTPENMAAISQTTVCSREYN